MTTEEETLEDDASTSNQDDSGNKPERRRRRARPFPPTTFDDALILGQAIQEHAAGQKVRRLTLFDNMNRESDSTASRALITGSYQYGITTGSYKSEHLELTADGAAATSPDASPRERFTAQFKLAIERNDWFRKLHEKFQGNRLPTAGVLRDFLISEGLDGEFVNECVDTFVVNAKFLGLLRAVAGAERLLSRDHALDDLTNAEEGSRTSPQIIEGTLADIGSEIVAPAVEIKVREGLAGTCFYISPIGNLDSEERLHSDLFMGALVEPALQEFGLRLVRADQMTEPGLISKQVIEYIARAPLVIADLSFHNPNVFYELALRHAVRKPIVQIIRSSDLLPFDVREFRTIQIDTTSIYTLVPQLETYKAEIASQIRMSLESNAGENPLTIFYPEFWNDAQ